MPEFKFKDGAEIISLHHSTAPLDFSALPEVVKLLKFAVSHRTQYLPTSKRDGETLLHPDVIRQTLPLNDHITLLDGANHAKQAQGQILRQPDSHLEHLGLSFIHPHLSSQAVQH